MKIANTDPNLDQLDAPYFIEDNSATVNNLSPATVTARRCYTDLCEREESEYFLIRMVYAPLAAPPASLDVPPENPPRCFPPRGASACRAADRSAR